VGGGPVERGPLLGHLLPQLHGAARESAVGISGRRFRRACACCCWCARTRYNGHMKATLDPLNMDTRPTPSECPLQPGFFFA